MRRWLLVFMLLLVPAQFTWAAVANYCRHEAGSASTHIGHHEHVDHASGEPGSKTAKGSVVDHDCGHCHGQCAGMLDASTVFGCAADAAHTSTDTACRPSTRTLCPPERPQWRRLA